MERNEPFSLVLYDHHTDMQEPMAPDMLSCGDWALRVYQQNRNLRQLTFSAQELESGEAKDKVASIDRSVPFYLSAMSTFACKFSIHVKNSLKFVQFGKNIKNILINSVKSAIIKETRKRK